MAKKVDDRKRKPHPEKKNGSAHDAYVATQRGKNQSKNAGNLERLKAGAREWRD